MRPLNDSIIETASLCAEWANGKKDITRVYFFGSRVWGNPRDDSDLDIFIIAQPGAMIAEANEWKSSLDSILSFSTHLIDYHLADSELSENIANNGYLVFSRNNSSIDFDMPDAEECECLDSPQHTLGEKQ